MGRKNKKKIPEGPETPFCPHFEMCGGCFYQQFSYEGQKAEKLKKVQQLMDEACPGFPLTEALSSPRETGYRNKMEFSFGDSEKDGPLTLGLHERGSFYNIVPILDCRIVDSDYRAILWMTTEFFREKKLPYVHKRTHEGVLRHLLIRKSVATGEILVALVTSSQGISVPATGFQKNDPGPVGIPEWEPDWIAEYVERLLILDLYGRISGVLHIINDSLADVVQADRLVTLFGCDFIEEELLGLRFKISPFSFFQTNSTGSEVLYSVVRDYIGDVGGKTVFDLYSGTGTIAQLLAGGAIGTGQTTDLSDRSSEASVSSMAGKVIGVEIVEEAVEAARENAARNGLSNCEFIAGDVLTVLDNLTELPDVMVLDPPREGIHPKALPKLLAYGVEHFVYVSCKSESLARDMGPILEAGYCPVKAVCVDMFPWTKHIETVVLLSKG